MTVVPDTSAVIDGRVSERVESGAFEGETVAVPEAVVTELESQANDGRESGWDGLSELQRLAELADEGSVEVEYVGRRPGDGERHAAGEGAVDALIRDLATEKGATLLTSDKVQSEVARAKGLDVEYVDPEIRGDAPENLAIEEFFDDETMSVHLKTGVAPMAKRGAVGEMRFETIGDEPLTEDDLHEWVAEIETATRASSDGFTELDRNGMTIVQFGEYRIALARPPFSDGLEITAVRPIVETELDDYDYADDLRERLLDHQRGVLIAGAPGAGKSTLAGAVAGFLADSAFSVKTMEKPRDLQVGPEITQYTELDGQMENTADSLLMVRPDYTIYDEVRKTEDFSVFADMRLAGVGMIGVVHATRAIDALGRLVGRVELGMIPQVVDTVVYVEAGEIETVYDVRTEVKVPEGLTEEDLARPVIQVRDFETQRPEYEIYSFNRQVVTVPVGDADDEDSGVDRIAKQEIEREIRSVAHGSCEVDLKSANTAVVYVEEADISTVIGKGGGRITDIENRLGISIDVRTFDERPGGRGGRSGNASSGGGGGGGSRTGSGGGSSGAGEIVTPEITSRHVVVPMDGYAGETVEIQADGEYLFTATVSRGGEVQVSRGSAIAEELEDAIDRGRQVTVAPS
ncbi:PINc/VapC family ATPase [Halococcus agarilyticus]|uniref:PINc/VapC family ATPase n=1 Tax=Halococcus agarilyticus TaxID=1232219 RepID=UPI0006777848|nr:PINc/VapC family ATPase [Halococcus agarilyticus]